MSSTNRSNARDFHVADYYITPIDAIKSFMLEFADDELYYTLGHGWQKKIKVLDPCAGGNPQREFFVEFGEDDPKKLEKELRKVADIVQQQENGFSCVQKENGMSYPIALSSLGISGGGAIITNDLRSDSPATHHSDFLQATQEGIYDLVITNPPFAIAREIIEKALQVCKEGGFVVMLLRLNYIGSQERADFWQKYPPYAIYADNKRMSFTPDKGTDSIEYAHFVWKKGENNEFAKFKILTN